MERQEHQGTRNKEVTQRPIKDASVKRRNDPCGSSRGPR
jgi:hypothetical protein